MAVAEIIGAAIGVMLLVIVAYMLVGSVLTTAEVVTTAEKDVTALHESRINTGISLNKSEMEFTGKGFNFSVTNSGNEILSDFGEMDIYSWDGNTPDYQIYRYNDVCGVDNTWCKVAIVPDIIHPSQLDPGEKLWIWATFTSDDPIWFQVTTGNGVNAQTTLP